MSRSRITARIMTGIAATAIFSLAACNDYGYGDSRPGYSSDRPGRDRPNHNRPNRGNGRYDRDQRYDQDGSYYLSGKDRIYRNRDGNYYCKKPDGTTGLIVGGLAGGVLGNVIAPGGSKTLGTILGGLGGAVAGQAIDKGNVRCR